MKKRVEGRADRLRAAVLKQLRDPATGLFVDRNGSGHSALHANVSALMSGMVPPDDRGPAVDLIRRKRLSCNVYFSFFVLKALYDAGQADLASASICCTTPAGEVRASFERSAGEITYHLCVPDGCMAICVLDASVQAVVVDGAVIPCRSHHDDFGIRRMELDRRLGAGEHTIRLESVVIGTGL